MSDEPAYIRNFKTYSGGDPGIDDLENSKKNFTVPVIERSYT